MGADGGRPTPLEPGRKVPRPYRNIKKPVLKPALNQNKLLNSFFLRFDNLLLWESE